MVGSNARRRKWSSDVVPPKAHRVPLVGDLLQRRHEATVGLAPGPGRTRRAVCLDGEVGSHAGEQSRRRRRARPRVLVNILLHHGFAHVALVRAVTLGRERDDAPVQEVLEIDAVARIGRQALDGGAFLCPVEAAKVGVPVDLGAGVFVPAPNFNLAIEGEEVNAGIVAVHRERVGTDSVQPDAVLEPTPTVEDGNLNSGLVAQEYLITCRNSYKILLEIHGGYEWQINVLSKDVKDRMSVKDTASATTNGGVVMAIL